MALTPDGNLYDIRFSTSQEFNTTLPYLDFAKLDEAVSHTSHPTSLKLIADTLGTTLYSIQQFVRRDSREGPLVSPPLGTYDSLDLIHRQPAFDCSTLLPEPETRLRLITGAYFSEELREPFTFGDLPEDSIDSSQN